MGNRRLGRESALQMLYQVEISGISVDDVVENFWATQENFESDTQAFANLLVKGVLEEKKTIDVLIAKHATHWKLSRMATVDKNILRLAVYELKNCNDIPLKVSLNEAIEIGKRFGSEESGAFINGVLDKIAKEIKEENL